MNFERSLLSDPKQRSAHDKVLEEELRRLESFYPHYVDLLKQGNFEEVKDLLTRGKTSLDEMLKVSAHKENHDNYTILHWAVENNRIDIFAALKPYIKGIHINHKGILGLTPLHLAVHNDRVDVVKTLLGIPGIDINALPGHNYQQNSPIGCARNAEMVLMLVKAGADIESEKGKRDLTGVINNLIEEEKSEEVIKLYPFRGVV